MTRPARLTPSQLAFLAEVHDGIQYWDAVNQWIATRRIPVYLCRPGATFEALERAGYVALDGDYIRLSAWPKISKKGP